jgi:hypothetical protein
MAARVADARVARTNARLESMAAVLIDVVQTKGRGGWQQSLKLCRRVRQYGY